MCRSRRELSNKYLLAKIGVDTAENEPLEVWGKIFNIIHWCPYLRDELRPVDRVARRGGRAAGYRRRPEWNLSTESTTKGGAVEMGRTFSFLKYENGNRENANT